MNEILKKFNEHLHKVRKIDEKYIPTGRWFTEIVEKANNAFFEGSVKIDEDRIRLTSIETILKPGNISEEMEVDRLLTDTEVTTMFTTPVALVPAPGAGKFIQVTTDPIFITTYGTAAMTGGGTISLRCSSTIITAVISTTNSLLATANRIAFAGLLDTANGILLLPDQPINIANITGVFIKGTSTSTLRVRFKYRIHTL